MLQLDERNWAKRMFGSAHLGDARRTERLVLCAALQARQAGESSLATCGGDTAAAEGLYRLMNSEHFDTAAITRAGCLATVASLPEAGDILAIQDTTTLSYPKRLSPNLGPVGGKKSENTQGIHVHSTLLVALDTGETIGLAHQQFWIRDDDPTVPKGQEDTRPPETRESFKWFQGDKVALERLGPAAVRTITVCDREADITEYLSGKIARGERVVARSLHDRLVEGGEKKLRKVIKQMPAVADAIVHIPQRGGAHARQARDATVTLRSGRITLAPEGLPVEQRFAINVVWVHEDHPPAENEALDWLLLTTEPVVSAVEALRVLKCYTLRWRIEDFHKAWKSEGCDVEGRRQHSADSLERTAAMLAFVAVRLLQLRDAHDNGSKAPCTKYLTALQWRCLWQATEKGRALPKTPPDATWACRALAKLGGWMPKKGARPGHAKLWKGWDRLSERVDAIQLVFGMQREAL